LRRTTVAFAGEAAARRLIAEAVDDTLRAGADRDAAVSARAPESRSALSALERSGSDAPGRRPNPSIPTTRATSQTQASTTASTAA
jgi:hypothetical protein